MKLTVELVARTDSFLNPLKDRELDLRGLKIPAIENLGATKDAIDSLDLSDNAILSLSNLPRLTRLSSLSLANNPITQISGNVGTQLPNLRSLTLSGSQLRDLASLQPLFGLRKLEFLHLGSSPVMQQPHYRSWLVHNLPSLRWLDYAKVKGKERESATKLYTSSEGEGRPSELAQQLSAARVSATVNGGDVNGHGGPAARTFEVPGSGPGPEPQKAKGLSEEQRQRIRKAIERAGTLEEIQRLKRMLADGHLPSEREAKALTA